MSFSRDDIANKIKKLLKLAESSNVNEAASAAAKAQELMDRFEIEAAALQSETPTQQPDEPFEQFTDYETSGRLENWRGLMLHVLCQTNSCTCFKRRREKETTFVVIGRKTDAQTVRYMYSAMVSVVEGLAMQQRGEGRRFIASFKIGAAHAITERIKASKKETKQAIYSEAAQIGTQALMRVDNAVAMLAARDAELASHMAALKLKLKTGAGSRITNSDGYHQGVAAGKEANIGSSARPLTAGRTALGC